MEKVDQDYLDEILATTRAESQSSNKPDDFKEQETKITYEQIQVMAANLGKGDREQDMEVTMQFLQVCIVCLKYY